MYCMDVDSVLDLLKARPLQPPADLDVLTDREVVLVDEYTVHLNKGLAKEVAGYKSGTPFMKERVAKAVEEKLAKRAEDSDLRAEYVREYIRSVLDFCPTDWFAVTEDGDWVCDPDKFAEAPFEIKRLVESVEFRYIGGRKYLKINFVSKTQAMSIAAKFTLTQKVAVATTAIPWEEIASASAPQEDPWEAEIAELQKLSGPVQAGQAAVA